MFTALFIILFGAQGSGQAFGFMGDIKKGTKSAATIFKYLDSNFKIFKSNEEVNNMEITNDSNINLSLRNVSFYYPTNKEKKILDDISINFLPGKINAIVG